MSKQPAGVPRLQDMETVIHTIESMFLFVVGTLTIGKTPEIEVIFKSDGEIITTHDMAPELQNIASELTEDQIRAIIKTIRNHKTSEDE